MGAPLPNPHDERLRFAWKACRYGFARMEDEAEKKKVLAWIERMRPRFPGSPHLERWGRIVRGEEPEAARELQTVRGFFDLDPDRRAFWRPLVQSQPFTTIIPGRTTRERRAVLSRLP